MKYIILVCNLLLLFAAQGQQRKLTSEQYKHRGDSVVADQLLKKMRLSFTVTETQEKELKRAVAAGSQKRRELLSHFDTTKVFREKIHKVDRVQDSLYASIVGTINYALYKATIQQDMRQRQAVMEARIERQFGKFDSTKLKRTIYEKQ
ncbi:MAG TPA: hypothetical protein VJ720_01055 [Chitinophaga sp.]|nr:hypothetical protein [Chitinophaga sp.]